MATLIIHVDGTVLGASALNTNFAALNDEVRPVAKGGTGIASYTIGDLLSASATTTLAKIADVATGQVLTSGGVGVVPAWSGSPTLSGTLTMSGTGPVVKLSGGADAQILIGTGTDPGWTKPAIHLFDATSAGALWSDAATLSLGVNMYFNVQEKAHATGASAKLELTKDPRIEFSTAASVAADANIVFVERFRIDANSTAAETGLLLSVAGAALARVSVDAVDSAGVGFRGLRVPN